MKKHYDVLFSLTALTTFLVDRWSKIYVSDFLQHGDVVVMPGLKFSLMFNTGISFSLFSSPHGVISWELTAVIACIVASLIVAWRFYATSLASDIGFGLIIGGAIGNFVDRLWLGGVIDFIELYYRQWSWPTFNVADIAIVVGFLIVVIEAMYETKVK